MSTKQLYEKTSEGMKEVSPLVAIEDIYSKLSDTPLEALVSLYNHVKCEWKGSVADTRRTVPLFLRRSGLFITYNNGTKYITEFFSAGTDQITTEGWVKDSNWTSVPDEDYISAGVKPGIGTIGYEQLSDNLKQLFREKVNVTNFPDDEDIASIDNMLKLKDREADATNFQSKGYVILRKNLRLVNGVVKNILTQNMINKPNTIYEIRYDFDLNGEIIEVPEGCTLKFDSGSINNGKLLGIFTIKNSTGGFIGYFEFNKAVTCSDVEPEWFYNTLYGDSYAIQKAIILAANSYKKVILSNRTYKLNNAIYCYGKTYLLGNNTKFELLPDCTIDNDRIITNCKTIECSQNDEGCVNYENKFYKWVYTTNDTVVIDNIEIIGKSTYFKYFGEQLSVPRGILSFVDLDFLSINRFKRDMAEDWKNQPIWTFNVNNIEIKNCTILKNLPDKYTENFGAWLYGNKELNSIKIENCYFYGLKTDESIAITNRKGNVKNIIISNNTFISEDSEHLDGMTISVYSSFGILDISNNILIGRCVLPYNGKILKFINNNISSNFINVDKVDSNLIQIGGVDEDRIVTFSNNKVKTNGVIFYSYTDLYNVNISNNVISCKFLINKTSMEFHDIVIINNIMKCDGVIKSTSGSILKGIYISSNILEINGQDLVNFNVTKVKDVFILNNKIKFNNEKYHIAYTNLSFSGITFYNNIIDNNYYYDNDNDYYSRYNGEGKNVFNGISVRNYTPETISTSSKLYDLNSKNGIISYSNDESRLIIKIGNVVRKISTTDNLPATGGTSERPTNPTVGYQFYDYTQRKIIIWNGEVWIDGIGNPTDAKKQGTTEQRPSSVQIGYIYKDTTLNKLIIWEGTKWVNLDGTELAQ